MPKQEIDMTLFGEETQRPVSTGSTEGVDLSLFPEEEPEVQRHFKETEEISAVTGKPIKEFVGEGGPGASFLAHLKAGYVDDPFTMIDIYSSDRFPGLPKEERMGRYKIQNGEVIFKADNGKWYSESPDLFHQKLKKWMGQDVTTPTTVLGTLGAVKGPAGAGAGAGIGKWLEQEIGERIFGAPPKSKLSRAGEIGLEAVFGAGGELGGRVFGSQASKGLARLSGKKAKRIAKSAATDLPYIDFKKAADIQTLYREKYGVNLFDAQTTESRRLIERIKYYGDLPATADLVRAAKEIQDEQVKKAVSNYWNDLYQVRDTVIDKLASGRDVVKAANKYIQRLKGIRKAKAKPHYDAAFKAKTEIDISDHVVELDGLIEEWPLGSTERNALLKFRRMLHRKVKQEVLEDVPTGVVDAAGNPIFKQVATTKTVMVPESRIKLLDRVKKSVDAISKPVVGRPAVKREVIRDILRIKDNVLSDLDLANSHYKKARQLWADDSEAIEQLTNKTRLTDIAKLEGDNVVRATDRLFSTAGNSPEIVERMKNIIMSENPAAWNKALRTYLEGHYSKISKDVTGSTAKQFNAFWRKMSGTTEQDNILRKAMSDTQYLNFKEFADLLRRAGLVEGKESITATRQLMAAEESPGLALRFLKAKAYPLITYKKVIYDKLLDLGTDRGRRLMVEALLDTRSRGYLRRIRKLGPGTLKGLRVFGTFLSLAGGGDFALQKLLEATPYELKPAH